MDSLTIKQAVNSNNHAVNRLKHGDNRSAILALSEALQVLQSTLVIHQQSKFLHCSKERAREVTVGTSLSPGNTANKPDCHCRVGLGERLEDLQDRDYSIFNYPLVIFSEEKSTCFLCPTNKLQDPPALSYEQEQGDFLPLEVMVAIVLLNLAIAYHREGIVRQSRVCMKKALQLYNLVQESTFQSIRTEDLALTMPYGTLVFLAAANNVIHCSLVQEANYQVASQRLEQVMPLVQRPGLEPILVNALVLNVWTMRGMKLRHASAA